VEAAGIELAKRAEGEPQKMSPKGVPYQPDSREASISPRG